MASRGDSTGGKIKVRCECGQTLSAPAHLAGKRAKCPKCGRLLHIVAALPEPEIPTAETVPAGPTMADLLDEIGIEPAATSAPYDGISPAASGRCPGCSRPMAQAAVVCIECGYNRKLGKKMSTQVTAEKAPATSANPYAAGAPVERRSSSDRMSDAHSEMLNRVYVFLGTVGGLILLQFVLILLNPTIAMYAFSVTLVCTMAASAAGAIWLFVIAFREDPMHFVGCFLCGPYALYYIVTRWDECHRPALLQFAYPAYLLGMILVWLFVANVA